jgi:molecular chaperone DnaK (HSP70)
MEPIAAATAYGMLNPGQENANWLVYDLGGGTFDVAVVNNFNNVPQVICSDGNDHLGGKDLDESLMDYILDRINENGYTVNKTAFKNSLERLLERTLLKIMLESKKIELSEKVSEARIGNPHANLEDISVNIQLEDLLLKDDKKKTVKLVINLTTGIYNSVISPHIYKSLEICVKMLSDNNLRIGDINRVILVGGPTKYYYIQTLIEERFGLRIEQNGIDPMFAVAMGAAIQALIKPVNDTDVQEEIMRILDPAGPESKKCRVKLNYPNSTDNIVELITGKFEEEKASKVQSVTFERKDGGWRSNPISIDPDGTFVADLELMPNFLNTFRIILQDPDGDEFLVSPDSFSMIHPYIDAVTDIAPHNLNVTLYDGTCYAMVRKNEPLPSSNSHDFFTVSPILRSDKPQTILEIEITEGQSVFAERNLVVSKLVFTNEHINADLPPDTKVVVTITQHGDRSIEASASLLNTTREGRLESSKTAYTLDAINKFFQLLKSEEITIQQYLERWGSESDRKRFKEIGLENVKKEVENLIMLYKNTNETDHLTNAWNTIAETFVQIEQFETDFIFSRVEKRLKELGRIKKPQGKIEESQPVWNDTFNRLSEQYNRGLSEEEKNSAYKEAQHLEESFKEFDPVILYERLIYLLYMFANTREFTFINGFAEFLNAITKACREYNNFSVLSGIQPIVSSWNKDMDNTSRYKIFSNYLTRLRNIIPGSVYNAFKMEDEKDNFSLTDYETVANHFNKIFNDNESIFAFKYAAAMARFAAEGKVLREFVRCLKMLLDNRIEDFLDSKDEFINSYYIDENVSPKDSDSGSTNIRNLKSL